jgi:hypothetical protein
LSSNADLFVNSFIVFERDWELILATLTFVLWGIVLTLAVLKKTTKRNFTDMELITLALGGWPIPALFISLPALLLRAFIPDGILFALAITFMIVSASFAIRIARRDISLNFIFIPLLFFVFVFIRLGFAADIILPSYFDSAEHYRIIQVFLNMHEPSKFIWPTTSYYHVGYHVIVAALTSITHANTAQVMLIFGQIVLAAIPFPVYFFIHRITNSHTAAFFGIILAAFGWFMPAHAVNWGKYPALLSLLLIQFTLGMAVIKDRRMVALSLLASGLIHSRSVILLAVFGLTWILSNQIRDKRKLFLALAASMLGMSLLLINRNQVFGPIFEPYRVWVTLLVGLLAASTVRAFPRLIFFSTLAMLGILAMSFIPVSALYALLDRPLIEMVLFLPLTFLGGLGSVRLPKFAVMILAAFIIINAWINYNFSPSDCCQLAGRDDAAALDWMDKQLPVDARIAIASADLSIDPLSPPMQGTGTDAGIWVAPLTGRDVIILPYFIDFTSQEIYDSLCQQQVTHIYIGSRPQSFKVDFVAAMPARFGTIFHLPNSQIVQVLGCGIE